VEGVLGFVEEWPAYEGGRSRLLPLFGELVVSVSAVESVTSPLI
jgi:hypothetical protein